MKPLTLSKISALPTSLIALDVNVIAALHMDSHSSSTYVYFVSMPLRDCFNKDVVNLRPLESAIEVLGASLPSR